MDAPLKTWYCDKCGGKVTAENGYVLWHRRDLGEDLHYRIIHQGLCDDKSYLKSSALEDFLGVDGLNKLLAEISDGPILGIKRLDSHTDEQFHAYVDFFRRVQIPFYEQARKHFDQDFKEVANLNQQEFDLINSFRSLNTDGMRLEAARFLSFLLQTNTSSQPQQQPPKSHLDLQSTE